MSPVLQQYGLAGLVIATLASTVTTLALLLQRSWSARLRDKDEQIKQLSGVLNEKESRIEHLEDQRAATVGKILQAIEKLKGKRTFSPPDGTPSQRGPSSS